MDGIDESVEKFFREAICEARKLLIPHTEFRPMEFDPIEIPEDQSLATRMVATSGIYKGILVENPKEYECLLTMVDNLIKMPAGWVPFQVKHESEHLDEVRKIMCEKGVRAKYYYGVAFLENEGVENVTPFYAHYTMNVAFPLTFQELIRIESAPTILSPSDVRSIGIYRSMLLQATGQMAQ